MGVELLTERYKDKIARVLSCYDRIIVQGTVPGWCYAAGMTDYFYKHQIGIFDYPKWPSLYAIACAPTRSALPLKTGSGSSSCAAGRAFGKKSG